jgi:hypothetical protein
MRVTAAGVSACTLKEKDVLTELIGRRLRRYVSSALRFLKGSQWGNPSQGCLLRDG